MARSTSTDTEWLTLAEASRVLGVSTATLRRWSNAGRVRSFTTPGGHRRFSRSALERLLPSDRQRRPSIADAGLTPASLSRAYRREGQGVGASLPWVLALTNDQRVLFRERGHVLAASLVQYLDATLPENAAHHLRSAEVSAAEYGSVAAGLGLSLSQTVEGFLRFRAPFHRELAATARRRGFDTAQTTDLLETAERAMDTLLVATMTGHSLASGRGGRRRAMAARVHEEPSA